MREAAQLLQNGDTMAATAAIQRALHGTQANPETTQQADWTAFLQQALEPHDINPPHTPHTKARPDVNDKWQSMFARQPIEDADIIDVPDADAETADKGRFIAGSCTNHAGTRAYKLYIPSGYKDEPLPLVVMLHGCTQNPDDFAVGTDMNAIAEEHNCFVAYPAQTKNANGSQCWNWFQTSDQRRDNGEPAILADITREIIRTYKIDVRRVYVAGLSAGGAMAVVLAATYPELYAAVGIHSGLPYAVAHDLPTAFAAMNRSKLKVKTGQGHAQHVQLKAPTPLKKSVPAIVFHGDHDTTVSPVNGDQALAQCVSAIDDKSVCIDEERGAVPNGRSYTRAVVRDEQGRAVAEKWTIHGAGHAWSGGSDKGSYTDPKGPNASREMLRFFLTHRQVL